MSTSLSIDCNTVNRCTTVKRLFMFLALKKFYTFMVDILKTVQTKQPSKFFFMLLLWFFTNTVTLDTDCLSIQHLFTTIWWLLSWLCTLLYVCSQVPLHILFFASWWCAGNTVLYKTWGTVCVFCFPMMNTMHCNSTIMSFHLHFVALGTCTYTHTYTHTGCTDSEWGCLGRSKLHHIILQFLYTVHFSVEGVNTLKVA